MTSYVPEILNARGWFGSKGYRFATRAEAEADLMAKKAQEAKTRYPDEPSTILDTRVSESPHKATHVWNFEVNLPITRGGKPDDARKEGHSWKNRPTTSFTGR
jgi:hypothetical protein